MGPQDRGLPIRLPDLRAAGVAELGGQAGHVACRRAPRGPASCVTKPTERLVTLCGGPGAGGGVGNHWWK